MVVVSVVTGVFFDKGERGVIRRPKTEGYKETSRDLLYGLIGAGDSHASHPFCVICVDRLVNETIKQHYFAIYSRVPHPPGLGLSTL